MIRRAIHLSILLVGLSILAACSPGRATPVIPQPTPTVYYAPPTPAAHRPTTPLTPAQPPSGSTTVLLLGTDRRSINSGTNNTDTIMLFYLDPNAQRAVVLSLPRDLYVDIPGHGQGRINTAYGWGKEDGAGGLALAQQTVNRALGIPIQHAALVDFQTFVTVVDAIGGIDVEIPYDISDPTYPDSGIGFDPFYISAGHHHLDGTTALKYARTRATYGGDFDRTTRQRQVVMAIREQVMQLDLLPGLIAQSPQLWSALQGAFESDLTLSEMVDLTITASRIPADQITTAAIDETCTSPWVTPGGAAVLLPDQSAIDALVTGLFSQQSAEVPSP